MMSQVSSYIGAGILLIAAGSGAAIIIAKRDFYYTSSTILPPKIHTADWYVAHPDIARRDEMRCGGDAASISQAACQNVASAEEDLLADDLKNAAIANHAANSHLNSKAP